VVTVQTVPRREGGVTRHLGRQWLLRALECCLLVILLAATQVLSKRLWLLSNGDVEEYQRYAKAFWGQHPLGHALPVEYPPLAIAPFTLTLLPPGLDPHVAFAFWMGLLVLAGYYALLRIGGRVRALSYIGYFLLGTAATLLARFDIVPALATLLALWCAQRRRYGRAYVLLAVGVLLKLYPIFLVPVVMIDHWRAAAQVAGIEDGGDANLWSWARWRRAPGSSLRRVWMHPATGPVLRGAALCGGLILGGFLTAYLLDPAGALSGFRYAGQRPLQVESTPASILWLGTLVGIPAHADYSFVSLNFAGALDVLLKPLSAVALAGGCLWAYWRQARGQLSVERAFLACICIVLVTNKIFSPQYLIWVLPLVAYVEGFSPVWVAICFLTWLEFPIMYQWRHPIWTVTYTPGFMPVVALRNGLLLWATLHAIIGRGRPQPRPPVAEMGDLAGDEAAPKREYGDPEPSLAR
jgi:Glycosyltransferase family 87